MCSSTAIRLLGVSKVGMGLAQDTDALKGDSSVFFALLNGLLKVIVLKHTKHRI